MRFWGFILTGIIGLGLSACTHQNSKQENDSAARKAGRAAYGITQDTKEAARKAAQELQKASKEAQAGWNEAKRNDEAKGKK